MLPHGMEELKSIGGDWLWGDDEKDPRTLIDRRIPTLAETDNCFRTRSSCHQVAVDGLIKLGSSKNILGTTPASDGHGSLGYREIAC